MVRCLIHGHNQQYKMTCKGDDAEDMCGNTLEPDPRYDSCCSNIFRPGKVLRDIIKGLLVVLGIAVVIAVVFVIIFYVVPAAHEIAEDAPTAAAAAPTERTIVSVSSTGPGAKVEVKSSESEVSAAPSSSLPPLLDVLGPHATPAAPAQGSCRPRSLEMCGDLPYALTALPNWANDRTDHELHNASLPFFRDVIVRSSCSPRAREYSCAILEPPCGASGAILPPCRTFCRSVASTCQEFVIKGFGLSDVFNCDKFPDSTDPAVCFDATQGLSSSTPSASETPEEPRTSFPGEDLATTFPEDVTEDAVTEGAVEETTFFTAAPETCPELVCLDGTCLAISQLNDGVNDCPDGTDEQNFSELIS